MSKRTAPCPVCKALKVSLAAPAIDAAFFLPTMTFAVCGHQVKGEISTALNLRVNAAALKSQWEHEAKNSSGQFSPAQFSKPSFFRLMSSSEILDPSVSPGKVVAA